MFGRKSSKKQTTAKTWSRLIHEKNGRRLDYVEMELTRPIKPARPGVKVVPPDKFE